MIKGQVGSLRKTFVYKSSKDIKLSQIQLSKVINSGKFLGRIIGPLVKVGLPLVKNVPVSWYRIQEFMKNIRISNNCTNYVKSTYERHIESGYIS